MTDLRETIARTAQKAHHESGRRIAPPWETLDRFEQERWLVLADAVIAVLPEGTKLAVVKPLNLGHSIGTRKG